MVAVGRIQPFSVVLGSPNSEVSRGGLGAGALAEARLRAHLRRFERRVYERPTRIDLSTRICKIRKSACARGSYLWVPVGISRKGRDDQTNIGCGLDARGDA